MRKIKTCAASVPVPETGCVAQPGTDFTVKITSGTGTSKTGNTLIGYGDGSDTYWSDDTFGSIEYIDGHQSGDLVNLFVTEFFDGGVGNLSWSSKGDIVQTLFIDGVEQDIYGEVPVLYFTSEEVGVTKCFSFSIEIGG